MTDDTNPTVDRSPTLLGAPIVPPLPDTPYAITPDVLASLDDPRAVRLLALSWTLTLDHGRSGVTGLDYLIRETERIERYIWGGGAYWAERDRDLRGRAG